MRHLHDWGVCYLLAALFLTAWAGQAAAQWDTIHTLGWSEFWAATLENWQSEFLQLLFQTVFVVALADRMFRRSLHDLRRIETKLDKLQSRSHTT